MTFPGLGKYRIIQRGVHVFMVQRLFLGLFWVDVLHNDQSSEDKCHEILNMWAEDAKVAGKVVWP